MPVFGEPTKSVPAIENDKITDIYFGKKVLTPAFENTTEEVVAKKGDTEKTIKAQFIKLKKIKKEAITAYTPEKVFVKAAGGEKITITYRKKVADTVSYEKITNTKVKQKVWVVAVCNIFTLEGKLGVEIMEHKQTNSELVYENPVKFLEGETEKTKLEFDLTKDKTVEPNIFAKEITLQPKSKEDVKKLIDKFAKRKDKNAFLYLKGTITDTQKVTFSSFLPNQKENIEYLNTDGKRLEISGAPCYCDRDIKVKEMIDIIYNLRDKENVKKKRDDFFNQGGEFIASIRITTGKISENEDKLKLFTDEMNNMYRKFGINTCKRKIHFIGQMYLETIKFRYTYESRDEVPDNYKGGVSFQGRGMKQITHDYNYLAYYDYVNGTTLSKVYFKYRSGFEGVGECVKNRVKANNEGLNDKFYENLKVFAKNISENLFHSFNSAGWFSTIYKTETINEMDKGIENANVEKVTKAINGGTNNLLERQNYTKWTKEFFNYDTDCVNK